MKADRLMSFMSPRIEEALLVISDMEQEISAFRLH